MIVESYFMHYLIYVRSSSRGALATWRSSKRKGCNIRQLDGRVLVRARHDGVNKLKIQHSSCQDFSL